MFVVGEGKDEGDNDDVYRTALGGEGSFHLPQQLCAGYNCTVISCGAESVSDPSSFLLGPAKEGDDVGGGDGCATNESRTTGILPRLTKDIFDQLRSNNEAAALAGNVPMEYTIRCSAVKVCGDRMRDLLHEPSIVHLHRHTGALGNCAALSCVSSHDVVHIVHRANAVRLCSRLDRDAGAASSMVVQITLEQYNPQTEESLQSRLLIVELEAVEGPNGGGASVAILQQHVRETADRQAVQPSSVGLSPSNPLDPTIRQLLSQSLGGNAYTSVVLHVGDGQSNSARTVLQFGAACQQVLNRPVRNFVGDRWQSTHERVEALQYQLNCFQQLTGALADECHRLRHRPGGANHLVDRKLWNFIEEIQHRAANPSSEGHRSQGLHFSSETREEQQVRRDLMKLRSGLRRTEKERDDAISMLRQLESDLTIVTNELHVLQEQQKKQASSEHIASENDALKQRNYELENRLRTSLFRESEAVVFLRQYRKFYSRLLHQQAAKGSGTVNDIIFGAPGAPPDLDQLVDLDQFMVECGLLEVDEVGLDTPTKVNRPSQDAFLRSTELAAQAEASVIEKVPIANPSPAGLAAHSFPLSIGTRHESGDATEARQKLFQTPSGQYIELREAQLEKEIQELTACCHKLESQLKDERDVTSALNGGNASSGTSDAELLGLKKALERREKDINAVIWKMNELHIAGKAFREKAESLQPHIASIEGTLAIVEADFRKCTCERSDLESKYRDEVQQLRTKVAAVVQPTWHVIGRTKAAPTLESRLVIPFSSADPTSCSVEGNESLLDRYVCTGIVKTNESGTQTDPIQFGSEALDNMDYSHVREAPSSREVPRAKSSLTPDDFLFMDEDSFNYGHETQCVNASVLDAHGVEEAVEALAQSTTHSEPTQLNRVLGSRQQSNPTLGSRQQSDRMLGSRQGSNRTLALGSHSHHTTTSRFQTIAKPNTAILSRSLSQSKVAVSTHSAHAVAVPKTESSDNGNYSSKEGVLRRSSLAHVESRSPTTRESDTPTASVPTSDHGTLSQSEVADSDQSTGNPDAALLPRRSEHSFGSLSNAMIDAQRENQSHAPSLSTFMGKFRKKASAAQVEDDEQSSTPEFMKVFKKIGFKKSEEVIETQGAAAVRELTRTAYGEHAVETIRNEKGGAEKGSSEALAQYSSPAAKKWVPRKKKDDDSDSDDSFARKFLGTADDSDSESESGSANEPEPSCEPQETPDLQQRALLDEAKSESPKQSVVAESSEAVLTSSPGNADDIESDNAVKTPPWKKKDAAPPPLPQSIGSPWKAKPSASSSRWSAKPTSSTTETQTQLPSSPSTATDDPDSDADEDEKPKTPPWKKKNAAPPPPPQPQRAEPRKAKDDAESDSDDEKRRAPTLKRNEPSAAPHPAAVRSKRSESYSDSDSDEDKNPKTPPWKKKDAAPPPPPAPAFVSPVQSKARVVPASINTNVQSSGLQAGPATSTSATGNDGKPMQSVSQGRAGKDQDDSSGSDESESDDEPPNRAPTRPPIAATANRTSSVKAPIKKTVHDDDDDSSGDDSSTEHPIKTPPAAKPSTAPSQLSSQTSQPKTSHDTSESSDEDSSDDEKTAPRPIPGSLTSKRMDDSSDDESDSEEDTGAKSRTAVVNSTASSSAAAAPAAIKPLNTKSDESSSEDDASSDVEDSPVRGAPKSTVGTSKPLVPPINKDDSSEEDSSDDEALPSAQPSKPQPVAASRNVPHVSSSADSSEEDSIDEEQGKTSNTKPTPPASVSKAPAAPPQRTPAHDEETETEDASDEEDAPLRPVPAPTKPSKPSIGPINDSESEEESSDDESPKPSKKPLPSLPPKPSTTTKPTHPTSTNDSDSDDSDEEPPRSVSKADPPSSLQDAHAADDETGSDTDGDGGDDGFVMAVGKPTGFEPTRQVPDFGAQVTPSVTQAANHMAGWSDSKREKAKFVIRNGQLVKSGCDSSVVSEAASVASSVVTITSPNRKSKGTSPPAAAATSGPTAAGKTKFVIRDGKLVKDDGEHGSGSPHADEVRGKDPKAAVSDKKALKMEPSSPRKKGGSKGGGSAKLTTSALFVIKDGKLVKSPGGIPPLTAPTAAPTGPPPASAGPATGKAPAFSIVNGKLVKLDDAPLSPPSKSKKSDRKEKKDKEKKHKKKKAKS